MISVDEKIDRCRVKWNETDYGMYCELRLTFHFRFNLSINFFELIRAFHVNA
jgi:hypothetical protein